MILRPKLMVAMFFFVVFFFKLQQVPGRAAEIIVTYRVGLMEDSQL